MVSLPVRGSPIVPRKAAALGTVHGRPATQAIEPCALGHLIAAGGVLRNQTLPHVEHDLNGFLGCVVLDAERSATLPRTTSMVRRRVKVP